MKGWKKIFHTNGNQKTAEAHILLSNKRDFKTNTVIKDKEEYYIIIKGSIQQEDIIFVNTYATNIGVPKYVKKIIVDLKGEIDSSIIIVDNLIPPLTSMDRSSRQKINGETLALNDTLSQIYLIIIYKTSYSNAAEYTFLSAHETLFRVNHISLINLILKPY